MTVTELLTLLSAFTAAVIAIIAAVKAPQTRAAIDDTNTRVVTLGAQINGRLADLLEATRQAAFHAGWLEGQRASRTREEA
jgi:hypothetical protein